MGMSFSCGSNDADMFEVTNGTLTVRSLSFKRDEVITTMRSVSFSGRDSEPTIFKSSTSGKMVLEGSVSFKRRETNTLLVDTVCSTGMGNECKRLKSCREPDDAPSCAAAENDLVEKIPLSPGSCPSSPQYKAAVQLQKVYRSFRTRRKLADCAVLVEQQWWMLLDYADLKRSSVSFFDIDKPESAVSRWTRAINRAAKVGKGLSKDEKARKLAFQHWLEAIDPRHRYGHNLHFYFVNWLKCSSKEPFFYWLDVGRGRNCNHEKCSRSKLQQECIIYLGPKEREAYEVAIEEGKLLFIKSGKVVDTSEKIGKDSKWIFVLSTSKRLYVGQKRKGTFQHSSFLAGGATSAAGRLEAEKGVLKAIWPHSGHYRPVEENFEQFKSFLVENGVDLAKVKSNPTDAEAVVWEKLCSSHISIGHVPIDVDLAQEEPDSATPESTTQLEFEPRHSNRTTMEGFRAIESERTETLETDDQIIKAFSASVLIPTQATLDEEEKAINSEKENIPFQQNSYVCDQQEGAEIVPKAAILQRLNSKKDVKSYQLGKQLSCKWSTGAGPRIGCMRDYPIEMQSHALEQMDLSPRTTGHLSRRGSLSPRHITSPSPLSFSRESSKQPHQKQQLQKPRSLDRNDRT